MDYPADSTAKLCQGGKGRFVGREGVPVDNCPREKCEPVIVFDRYYCIQSFCHLKALGKRFEKFIFVLLYWHAQA